MFYVTTQWAWRILYQVKEPVTERQVLHDYASVRFLKQILKIHDRNSSYQGPGGGRHGEA